MNLHSSDVLLNFGLGFEDLYQHDGLVRLDGVFLVHLKSADPALHARLVAARQHPAQLARKDQSELIVDVAPHLEDFIGRLFGITAEVEALQARHNRLTPLYTVKRNFVQRKAVPKIPKEKAVTSDGPAMACELERLFGEPLTELVFAQHVARWIEDETANAAELDLAMQYAAWATLAPEGIARHKHGVLFKTPHKLDMNHLVPVEDTPVNGVPALRLHPSHWRNRAGFELTDPGTDLTGALDHAAYCIKCHNQGKDSCSTGLREKNGAFKPTVFAVTLPGSPPA